MSFSLKKSRSSYDKKYSHRFSNPESSERTDTASSHVEEMILQKYNFSHRFKTNIYENPIKCQSTNKTAFVPTSQIIAITQLPKIELSQNNSKESLFESFNKIRTKQQQNSFEKSDYTFVNPPPRKVSDYNQCIKRIQMNTTYRGFNFTRSKLQHKNRYFQPQKVSNQKNEEINKSPLKAAERKMIIQHIIEKGFARKMEDELIKVRNEKKKVHLDLESKKNTRLIQAMKSKRSVIFSQVESAPVCKTKTLRNSEAKQHLIEPW